jgi:uncharacterized repeat protein (TIGR03803 family)
MTTNGGHSNDGVIFKIKTDGSSFHLLHKFGETHHDGKNPYGSLLLVDDKLYGTTANGGDNDLGTVFVINADGNNYQRLYSFSGQTNNWDGSKPIDNVILVNGWLYGMTTEGGAYGQGGESNPGEESNSEAQANAAGLAVRPLEIRSTTT